MLNEERIILMTKLASYEENEGKKDIAIINYFRNDYIGIQVLKAVISATIAYAIIFALFIFYDFEVFMLDVYKMDLIGFAQQVLIYYGITVIGFGALSYVLYSYRYVKAKRSLKCYYQNLKKLYMIYYQQK